MLFYEYCLDLVVDQLRIGVLLLSLSIASASQSLLHRMVVDESLLLVLSDECSELFGLFFLGIHLHDRLLLVNIPIDSDFLTRASGYDDVLLHVVSLEYTLIRYSYHRLDLDFFMRLHGCLVFLGNPQLSLSSGLDFIVLWPIKGRYDLVCDSICAYF